MINRSTYYLQAPVGNQSYLNKRDASGGEVHALNNLDGWDTTWLGSGTMSIAVAVLIAVERRPQEKPKVMIPAYGCPDLVSAIRFAGAEPVYVDMLPDECNMDLRLARRRLASTSDVIAIIGVDLFGVPENWDGLKTLAKTFDLFLIQDLAQSVQMPETMRDEFRGDAAIFSFGRGKPVCCLTGGALLTRAAIAGEIHPLISRLRKEYGEAAPRLIGTKTAIYNFLLWPFAYAHLARLMGDSLGQTRYKPLTELNFLNNAIARRLDAAVAYYWSECTDRYEDMVVAIASATKDSSDPQITILKNSRKFGTPRRLLRLPVLAGRAELREELLRAVLRHGISATKMYGRTLPDIVAEFDGCENIESVPNARAFADKLITLPLHSRLSRYDIDCVCEALTSEIVV